MTKWLLTPYGSLSHRAFCNLTISQNSGGAVWTVGRDHEKAAGCKTVCSHTALLYCPPHVPGASQVWRCRAGGEGPCGEKVHGLTCVHAEGRDRLQLAEPRRLMRGYWMRSKNSGEAPTFLTEAGEVLSFSVHVSI